MHIRFGFELFHYIQLFLQFSILFILVQPQIKIVVLAQIHTIPHLAHIET